MYDDTPYFKRSGLAHQILIPQLVLLTLFVVSRASVWAVIAGGATSLSSFFLDIVSAGAGWAMLSLSTLMASLLWHHGGTSKHFEDVLQKDRFQSFSAYAFELELKVAHAACRSTRRWSLFLSAIVVAMGVGTIVGATAYPEASIETNLPMLLAVVIACASSFFLSVVLDCEFEVRPILANVYGVGFQWTAEQAAQMSDLLEAISADAVGTRLYIETQLEGHGHRRQ